MQYCNRFWSPRCATSKDPAAPINLSLEIFGDRWSLIVIRDMMFGNRRHLTDPDPTKIIAAVRRGHQALDSIH
jgi:hypothetical protein